MAANLVVMSNIKDINLSKFDLSEVLKPPQDGNINHEEISYLMSLNLQNCAVNISALFGFNEAIIHTNLEYCLNVRLHHNVISFEPAGFPTKFSTWKGIFLGNKLSKTEENKNWENWTNFKRFTQALVKILGGKIIIYIDDGSLQMEDELLNNKNGINAFFKAMSKKMDSWPLEYLENFAEDFTNNSCFFFEKR